MFEELKAELAARGVDFEVVDVFSVPTLTVFSASGEQTTVQIRGGEIWIWGAGGRGFTSPTAAAWTLSVIAEIC